MAIRTKHRSAAAQVVGDVLKRAENRIANSSRLAEAQVKESLLKEHAALVKKFHKADVERNKLRNELNALGLQEYNGLFSVRRPFMEQLLKPAAIARDKKLEALQELELDVALLGIADNADLQSATRQLIEKINKVVEG